MTPQAQTNRLTLLLNHQIAAVITAMRYNSKWAVVPKYYEEDRNETNKYDDAFRNLRSEIFKYQDWSTVDPMVYLGPFLSLIKASDVSGPITGAAAVALQRIFNSDLLSRDTYNVEAAINQIVEDATQCKFESTNNASDEIVLLNIVQVLGQAVDCPAGLLLSDESVCKAFQAAFLLGDPATKIKEYGDIMGYYSRQTCGSMIRTVYRRLAIQAQHEQAAVVVAPEGVPAMGSSAAPMSSTLDAEALPLCRHGVKAAYEIMYFLVDLVKKGLASSGGPDPALGRDQTEETIMFAMDMIHSALLAAGPHLLHYDVLIGQLQCEMLHVLCQAAVMFTTVSIINGFSQIVLAIYHFLGAISMGQLELILERVLLRLADGKGVVTLEQQEAALEGLLDLCRQPGFVHDVFVNCDCRIERSNLFEDVCGLISKTAFPVAKGSLGPLHFISLEALLAILQALAAGTRGSHRLAPPPPPSLDAGAFVDVWTPISQGEHPALPPGLVLGQGRASSVTDSDEPGSSGATLENDATLRLLHGAVLEKHLKQRVKVAVDIFNKDCKKGLQALQSVNLFPKLGDPLPEGFIPATLLGTATAAPSSPHHAAATAGLPSASAAPLASPPAAAAEALVEADEAASVSSVVDERLLANSLGRFLRVCPGLAKTTIGELLGEPDAFYLKVLKAYTRSFDFRELKFDQAIRLYLESFRLPGEAQKIDRIINSFGLHFYKHNQSIFKSADAAYILAFSVIMLNTDRHNQGVKDKMTVESFRRNLRGVNEGKDFPEEFLNDIYVSISKTALRMSEQGSMDVSEQLLVQLCQASRTPRGRLLPSAPGRWLFDTTMFRLVWGPAVHAMCSVIDNVSNESLLEAALNGLQVAAQIATSHELEDVADSIIVNLSKIPQQIAHHQGTRPELVFGRDPKMRVVTRAIAAIVNKHGDCLRSGWVNVMDLILGFYRQGMLPDSFCKALVGDGDGGLCIREGEALSLKARKDRAKGNGNLGGGSLLFKSFNSISQMLALPGSVTEPEYPERASSDIGRAAIITAEETLARCSFEDIFTDSKFLKQDSLTHLVKAIIWASGPIPRGGAGGGSAAAASGATSWDVSELCLELLFTVLLRNRDRITLLWPKIYDHFQNIFSHSKECDLTLVQKAIMAMMRLCQRLLPYKTDVSEPLMRGIQLVSLVDDRVAGDLAGTIAVEILNLLKGAAPYIHNQQAWISICSLVKIIQYDPASFATCVETLTWVVKESLTMLNYTIVMQTVVDLLERSVPSEPSGRKGVDPRPGHPQHVAAVLDLVLRCEEWLELWWQQVKAQHSPSEQARLGMDSFKQDSWLFLISMLCKLSANSNVDVRKAAVEYLQKGVIAAEALAVDAESIQRSLEILLLPLMKDLCKAAGGRDMVQADATLRDLVRVLTKLILLYQPQLEGLPTFGLIWRSILEVLVSALGANGGRSEVLTEAVPEAMKNMLLVLHAKGTLNDKWRDTDGTDLWELTWHRAKKMSSNLTPAMMVN